MQYYTEQWKQHGHTDVVVQKKKSVTSSYHCKFLINSVWLHDITTIISAIHQTVQSENAFEQGHLRIKREPVMCIKLIFSFLSSFAAFEKSQHVAHVAWWKRMKTGRLKNNTELKHCRQWMPGPLQNMRSSVMTIAIFRDWPQWKWFLKQTFSFVVYVKKSYALFCIYTVLQEV